MLKPSVRFAAALAATFSCLASFPRGRARQRESLPQPGAALRADRARAPRRSRSTPRCSPPPTKAASTWPSACSELGASLDARDRLGARPLARAAAPARSRWSRCSSSRARRSMRSNLDGSTALYQAAENGRLPIVQPPDRARREREPSRPQRHHAAVGGRLYGQRADRRAVHGEGRRSENDRQTRARRPSSMPRAAASRRWCASCSTMASTSTRRYGNDLTALMWAAGYSDEAGVQGRGRGHEIAARSRRAYRRCRTIAAAPR